MHLSKASYHPKDKLSHADTYSGFYCHMCLHLFISIYHYKFKLLSMQAHIPDSLVYVFAFLPIPLYHHTCILRINIYKIAITYFSSTAICVCILHSYHTFKINFYHMHAHIPDFLLYVFAFYVFIYYHNLTHISQMHVHIIVFCYMYLHFQPQEKNKTFSYTHTFFGSTDTYHKLSFILSYT